MNSYMQMIECFYFNKKQKRNILNKEISKPKTLGLMYKTITPKSVSQIQLMLTETQAQCKYCSISYYYYRCITEASVLFVQEIACLMTAFEKMPSFLEVSSHLYETCYLHRTRKTWTFLVEYD